ncbi:PBP1A family penicillin-binding protein [Paenibacillus sp. KQZ6P-2]|uniref:PBP1A family penicillin-binding protein n=1 Tax=Paenibacillus mangrovi TaxID=2931978 RepID=A0A9X1WPG6_9BACL|nr:PBP1A family penicillin-binding protein [Paenibacillus mangrovi]MCJ8012669.1 PBP1A family penicillin-binding protein [Paenibacillus mangrovi]
MSGLQAVVRRKLLRSFYYAFDLAVILAALVLAGLFYVHEYGGIVLGRYPEKLVLRESSVITASDGTVLRKIPLPESGYRVTAELEEMPDLLIDTFLAVEDRSFYLHHGLDYKGIARAILNNTAHFQVSEGGSTITQQLARNLFLNRDKNMLRKLNEASLALALEKRLSKHDILQLYLNQIYMGDSQHGVKAAAEHYFGISDLKKLDIMQIAALAAIPKGPSIYNPLGDSELPVKRRELVLGIMRQQGLITGEEMMAAVHEEYKPPAAVNNKTIGASYIDAALQEATRLTGKSREELQTGGYTIVTGMNRAAQSALEESFRNPDLFPPNGKDQQVEAAMVMIDHRTGEIVALTGGRNPVTGGLNRAVIDARQPGSAFKPIIVYGPVLESGFYTPESMLQDRQAAYGSYKPENLNGTYQGQMSMKQALQQSVNAPAVWLLQQVGISKAQKFAAKLGIELTQEDYNLSIALGGVHTGVSPLKMAQAYSVFASGGFFREAHMVRQIKDSKGRVLYSHHSNERQAISPLTAERMTGMLRSVVNEGTGKKACMNRPVAGKTGTTQLDLPGISSKANRDLWFVGYTPEWTAAVWMGFDRTDQNNYMTAGSGKAAALFSAVMSKALEGYK